MKRALGSLLKSFTDPMQLGHDSRPRLKTIVFLPQISSHFSSIDLSAFVASDFGKVPMPVVKPFLRIIEAIQSFLKGRRACRSLDNQSLAISASIPETGLAFLCVWMLAAIPVAAKPVT